MVPEIVVIAVAVLMFALGVIYIAAHIQSGERQLYRKDEIIRYIPPKK